MLRILLIDDDTAFSKLVMNYLIRNNYHVESASSFKQAKEYINKNTYEIILCDLRLPDSDGIEILTEIKTKFPEINFVMMTSYAEVSTAVKSIKLGATDYIAKPFATEELKNIIEGIENKHNKNKTINETSTKIGISPIYQEKEFLTGSSTASKQLSQHIQLVGPTDFSILIIGESGTGKEVIARSIHQNSNRKNEAFIAVDCGAIPKELAASEFFGHIKGSFTGAVNDKIGSFEAANHGTLFLDEIGNLNYENQIQLLRALQERKIKKVGSNVDTEVDIRIIAATNEDLYEAVKKGNFREDLYHRLNEFKIYSPALRDRGQDLIYFAEFFLTKANKTLEKNIIGFSEEVIEIFKQYPWPGNLRELQNVVKRCTLLTQSDYIQKNVIPLELLHYKLPDKVKNTTIGLTKDDAEKEAIIRALELCQHNKTEAAKMLKITRKTLYNKIKHYQLE